MSELESILIGDCFHVVDDAAAETSNEDGESDYPTLRFCAFSDGCYFYQSHALGTRCFTLGHVNERVIERFLLDAENLGFEKFESVLSVASPMFPDLCLTISSARGSHTVVYSQICDEDTATQAKGLGEPRSMQLHIAHLLGARLLDLAGDLR